MKTILLLLVFAGANSLLADQYWNLTVEIKPAVKMLKSENGESLPKVLPIEAGTLGGDDLQVVCINWEEKEPHAKWIILKKETKHIEMFKYKVRDDIRGELKIKRFKVTNPSYVKLLNSIEDEKIISKIIGNILLDTKPFAVSAIVIDSNENIPDSEVFSISLKSMKQRPEKSFTDSDWNVHMKSIGKTIKTPFKWKRVALQMALAEHLLGEDESLIKEDKERILLSLKKGFASDLRKLLREATNSSQWEKSISCSRLLEILNNP